VQYRGKAGNRLVLGAGLRFELFFQGWGHGQSETVQMTIKDVSMKAGDLIGVIQVLNRGSDDAIPTAVTSLEMESPRKNQH
jgi:hypothetical protein